MNEQDCMTEQVIEVAIETVQCAGCRAIVMVTGNRYCPQCGLKLVR